MTLFKWKTKHEKMWAQHKAFVEKAQRAEDPYSDRWFALELVRNHIEQLEQP